MARTKLDTDGFFHRNKREEKYLNENVDVEINREKINDISGDNTS
jgi:hypothetical protein